MGSGRFLHFFKMKFNNLLNKVEDPAEALDYAYQQQVEMLQGVKRGIADVVTAKKRLEMQRGKLEQQVLKLDQQARQALTIGNEELARTAVERKRFAQVELQSLDGQVEELAVQQETLIQRQGGLQTKIEQFRVKKEVIKAQYAAAEAQVNIASATSGIGGSMENVSAALNRANEKVEHMRAKADAVQELEEQGVFDDVLQLGHGGQDDIDRELAQTSGNAHIEAEIAKMKSDLQLPQAEEKIKSLPAGSIPPEHNL